MKSEQLIGLAQKHGTPLYVYDGDLILKKYRELKACFSWEKTKLFYAAKTNYNTKILKLLLNEGANIDTVSLGEARLALKVGFTTDQIIYTANSLSDANIKEGIELGLLFNIGSLSELERYGSMNPGVNVCLRFNPNVIASDIKTNQTGGQNSKFGIQLTDVTKAREIADRHQLKIIGVHEHTGSAISDVGAAFEGTKNLMSIVSKENFPDLEFVDFGGGFMVFYEPEKSPIDYSEFGEKISEAFAQCCEAFGKELYMYFEPGRFIVAESGHLLVHVNTLKNNDGLLFAGTDSGFPQMIRPAFHGSYHHIVNLSNPDGNPTKYNVHGNICENSDYFATDRSIPEIREGDILDIETAGAYGYSMGGVYNLFPMPAEVLVLNGTDSIARRRLSNEELINNIIEESE